MKPGEIIFEGRRRLQRQGFRLRDFCPEGRLGRLEGNGKGRGTLTL